MEQDSSRYELSKGCEKMSLKYKTNLVGDISIMAGTASFVLLIFSTFYEIKYEQFFLTLLLVLHYEMKIKYRELREMEIDKEVKMRNKNEIKKIV